MSFLIGLIAGCIVGRIAWLIIERWAHNRDRLRFK